MTHPSITTRKTLIASAAAGTLLTGSFLVALPAQAATTRSSTLSGTVFQDANRNGVRNSSEKVLPNRVINIYNTRGKLVRTVKTNQRGRYSVRLPRATYTVAPAVAKTEKVNRTTRITLKRNTTMNLPLIAVPAPKPVPQQTTKPAPKPVTVPRLTVKPASADNRPTEVLNQVNAMRRSAGLRPVSMNSCSLTKTQAQANADASKYTFTPTVASWSSCYSTAEIARSMSSPPRTVPVIVNAYRSQFMDPRLTSIAISFDASGEFGAYIWNY